MREHAILILGGGTAGITVAARLKRADRALDVAIVEPSHDHWYQPLWTLVGAGVTKLEETRRDEAAVMPKGVTWIQDRAAEIDAARHEVVLDGGERVRYEQLVVALGIEMDWDAIDGLPEALGRGGVVSNYLPNGAEATWQALRSFDGGTMVFTNPAGQVKCGGAPQKIMYLAEDYARRHGMRDRTTVIGAFAGTVMLGVPEINATLERIVRERDIEMRFRSELTAVDADAKEAVFQNLDDPSADPVRIGYDLLHVTPPMRAPAVARASGLAVAEGPHAGYIDVDHGTLRSVHDPDVFALGDVAAVPTAKTGAAVRKQAPVLVDHLLAHRRGGTSEKRYDGYSSCPLVTAYGRLVLAEFTYGNIHAPTFPVDQTKERWDMYMLKRHVLPRLYWYGMLRGLA
ncbi:MAG: FAD-dependent oxidoreductase [Jiangellaceae bacterium]